MTVCGGFKGCDNRKFEQGVPDCEDCLTDTFDAIKQSIPVVNKVYCAHCGRQICKNIWSKELQTRGPAVALCCGQVCCAECNEFDENGLLPGEPGYKEKEVLDYAIKSMDRTI